MQAQSIFRAFSTGTCKSFQIINVSYIVNSYQDPPCAIPW